MTPALSFNTVHRDSHSNLWTWSCSDIWELPKLFHNICTRLDPSYNANPHLIIKWRYFYINSKWPLICLGWFVWPHISLEVLLLGCLLVLFFFSVAGAVSFVAVVQRRNRGINGWREENMCSVPAAGCGLDFRVSIYYMFPLYCLLPTY